MVDENLLQNSYTENLTKRVASGIGTLKRIRSLVYPNTLKLILNALVRCYFDNCSVVSGNCNLTLSKNMQKLQNRAARIFTFCIQDTNVEHLFRKLRWRKLSAQREMQKAAIVFKSLYGLTPEYLSKLLVNRSDITEYLLRDSVNKLAVPLPRTNFLKNSFKPLLHVETFS